MLYFFKVASSARLWLPLPRKFPSVRFLSGAQFDSICFHFILTSLTFDEDLANQVKFSKYYRIALPKGAAPGRFLSVPTGEWFSGESSKFLQ